MVTGVSGVNFSSTLVEQGLDEGGVDRDFADIDARSSALPWPTVRTMPSKVDGLLGGLLQALEGLGARVELAAGARDEAAGLHVVDLDALLALGREAEIRLGLEAVGLGKRAQQHLAVADRRPGPSYSMPSRGSLPSSV